MLNKFIITLFLVPMHLFANETVILLHGLGRTPRSMKKVEKSLQEEGYHVINIGYPSKRSSIHEIAEKHLHPAIQSTSGPFHVVTHSLGGIVLRDYLAHHEINRLLSVIMLAPPNQGAKLATTLGKFRLFHFVLGPSFSELASGYQKHLPAPRCPTLVIAGNKSFNPLFSKILGRVSDGKVMIEESSLDGADQITIPASHTFIMNHQKALSLITMHLKKNGVKA